MNQKGNGGSLSEKEKKDGASSVLQNTSGF